MTSPIKQRHTLHQQLRENEAHISDLEKQIMAAQKLAAIGTMAYQMAHEFNNILAPMINSAELALKYEDDAALVRKALEKTIKRGNRAALIIQSMLGMVRDQTKSRQEVLLTAVMKDSFQTLARDLTKDRINVELNIPKDFTIFAIPSQMQQVFLNLIINARQAMLDTGGTLTIGAQKTDDRNVQITVSDSGCGIEVGLADKIFEPFFSTKTKADKPEKQGTGLGLSVCKNIIESHGGTIEVSSRPAEGTTFIINLPAKEKT